MSLVDMIEALGRDVAAGELDRATAAHRLQQYSDGGLTRRGAEDAIDNWRTRRAEYAAVFRRTEQQLDQLRRFGDVA